MARLGNPVVGHAHTAELALFIRGRLPSHRADFICEHILICGICQEEVQEITALLWPSLSIWSKCWLRFFSPSWPPSRVLGFLQRSRYRMRRSVAH
jgi:hypothetical protein